MEIKKYATKLLPSWTKEVPFQIKGIAIKEACNAFWAAKGRPKFRTRKTTTQSCFIPKTAIGIKRIYPRVSGNGLVFKGSKIGKSYTWGNLQRRGVKYEQDRHREEVISEQAEPLKFEVRSAVEAQQQITETIEQIAADLAIHKATVKRHVAKLKKPGMLKVVRRGQKTAIYTVKNWRGKAEKAENQLDLFTAA